MSLLSITRIEGQNHIYHYQEYCSWRLKATCNGTRLVNITQKGKFDYIMIFTKATKLFVSLIDKLEIHLQMLWRELFGIFFNF